MVAPHTRAHPSEQAHAAVPSPYTVPTILLAENDAGIAAITREVLEDEGYRVLVAPTHAAALVALAATRYALILADSKGTTLACDDPARWRPGEEIRAAAPDTPVVIFSAHHPGAFNGYRERGFAGLISKPFDLDALLATVGTFIGGREPRGVGRLSGAHAAGVPRGSDGDKGDEVGGACNHWNACMARSGRTSPRGRRRASRASCSRSPR
jgi:CheY-like chemotaxis protein